MRVKVCGFTRLEDAQLACNLGAWALGFIAYPPSPRYLTSEKAQVLISHLPKVPLKVGVFVNESAETINSFSEKAGFTHVQLHGNEPPEIIEQLNLPVFKAFRLENQSDLKNIQNYSAAKGFLIDAKTDQWGGSGHLSNWDLAKEVSTYGPLILAGGLTPENINEAILKTQPWALDVSSGVESTPGIKDKEKLTLLFERISP